MAWRKAQGKPEGFEAMRAGKPIVAVGPEHPLEEEELMADYFRESTLDNSRAEIRDAGPSNATLI